VTTMMNIVSNMINEGGEKIRNWKKYVASKLFTPMSIGHTRKTQI